MGNEQQKKAGQGGAPPEPVKDEAAPPTVEQLQDELDNVKAEREELTEKLVSTEAELEETTQRHQQDLAALEGVRAELSAANEALAGHNETLHAANVRLTEVEAERDDLKAQNERLSTEVVTARDEITQLERDLERERRRTEEARAAGGAPRPVGQIPTATGKGMAEFRGKTPGMHVQVRSDHQDGGEPSIYAGHRGVVIEIIEEQTTSDDGCPFLVDFGDPNRAPTSFHFDELVWA